VLCILRNVDDLAPLALLACGLPGRDARRPFVDAVGHPEASGSEQVADLSDGADSADDKAAAGPCGLNCHHTSFVRWDFPVVAVSWEPERMLTGIREIEFDSVAPEMLPEPPRTFA